jgi:hypothetical protein
MNLPIPSDSPAFWIGVGTAIGSALSTALIVVSPIFKALAVLMLDRSKCPLTRLRMLQSLTGKSPPGPQPDQLAKKKHGKVTRSRKRRDEGNKRGTTRNH